MQFQDLTIKHWAGWAPGLVEPAQWLAWSESPNLPTGNVDIKGEAIPPMLRRRCSKLSKMAIQTATRALANESVDYTIFCSQHGDVPCTVTLLQDICQQQTLSPTQFTQSVHNTSAGLFSIIHKLTNNSTFISSGDNTFFMGMLEALSWLQTHPEDQVLLVMADTYIPGMYQLLDIDNDDEYAVALLLSGRAFSMEGFTVELSSETNSTSQELPEALYFLAKFLTNTEQSITLSSQHQCLCWKKVA